MSNPTPSIPVSKVTVTGERHSSVNYLDEHGRPAGGHARGVVGFVIDWQDGPLGRVGSDERVEPNGAFVEDVLLAVVDRLEFYQASDFRCRENALAITKIEEALHWLESRTKRPKTR